MKSSVYIEKNCSSFVFHLLSYFDIHSFISYIFIDASGWVISDVSFGFMGDFGSCNIRAPHPNDLVGIDLTPTPTPIPAANLRIHTRRKK